MGRRVCENSKRNERKIGQNAFINSFCKTWSKTRPLTWVYSLLKFLWKIGTEHGLQHKCVLNPWSQIWSCSLSVKRVVKHSLEHGCVCLWLCLLVSLLNWQLIHTYFHTTMFFTTKMCCQTQLWTRVCLPLVVHSGFSTELTTNTYLFSFKWFK